MKRKEFWAENIREAREKILNNYLSNANRSYLRGRENIIYFDGWNGLGAPAVLSAIVESVRTTGCEFDIVIHVDCSLWVSRREMQRRIAEELKLDRSVMVLFDKQDEEDDFSGVDKGSRAEIDDVAELIFQAVDDRRCLIIFYNGSDHEIDLSTSGLPVFDSRNEVLWTFRGRFRLDPAITDKVKSADVFLSAYPGGNYWLTDELSKVVHEEAAQVRHDINPTAITDCWFYLSLLHYNLDNSIDYDIDSHTSNYWVCDGIISGDSAWEIGERLHEDMKLEYLPTEQDYFKWFVQFSSLQNRVNKKSQWTSITSKDLDVQNIQTIPKETTSYFLILEKSDSPTTLPKDLFQKSSKLHVLRLSCCSFSFVSPPFIYCSSLRFVFIDSCRDEDVEFTGKGDDKQDTEWTFLQRLWVLDIRCTSWDRILSPPKMMLMKELRELNLIDAVAGRSGWGMNTLDLTWLCNLQRLRMIRSSTFFTAVVPGSFMGMQKLELLDLSGNSDMEVLPNLSAASGLKVLILDGCNGATC